jgi:predicted MFS family arabinose efflux permease
VASGLNGIEFNLARAIGPTAAGIVIAAAGVSTAFIANVISFCGVITSGPQMETPNSNAEDEIPLQRRQPLGTYEQ